MGEIRDYSCSCGYEKRIFAGAGLNGCNLNVIKRFFSKEAEQFEAERQAKRVQSYLLKNAIVECPHCKKIESVPCFSYQTGEGTITFIKEECPDCGGKVNRLKDEENVACPECGLQMTYNQSGNWD